MLMTWVLGQAGRRRKGKEVILLPVYHWMWRIQRETVLWGGRSAVAGKFSDCGDANRPQSETFHASRLHATNAAPYTADSDFAFQCQCQYDTTGQDIPGAWNCCIDWCGLSQARLMKSAPVSSSSIWCLPLLTSCPRAACLLHSCSCSASGKRHVVGENRVEREGGGVSRGIPTIIPQPHRVHPRRQSDHQLLAWWSSLLACHPSGCCVLSHPSPHPSVWASQHLMMMMMQHIYCCFPSAHFALFRKDKKDACVTNKTLCICT